MSGALDSEFPLARLVIDAQVGRWRLARVGPLSRSGLREVIEQPARQAGLELEDGLAEAVLDDVADRPGSLPLLEHVLLEVWQRRRGRTLTLAAYAASGGVQGALAQRANAIYQGFVPDHQGIARRMLLRLIQPGEGTEDTRRRAAMSELLVGSDQETDLEAVAKALADARHRIWSPLRRTNLYSLPTATPGTSADQYPLPSLANGWS
ncbi:MAG: hypothetical protein ACRDRP_26150, partial [Pseudonocardiaceae bacterium]